MKIVFKEASMRNKKKIADMEQRIRNMEEVAKHQLSLWDSYERILDTLSQRITALEIAGGSK